MVSRQITCNVCRQVQKQAALGVLKIVGWAHQWGVGGCRGSCWGGHWRGRHSWGWGGFWGGRRCRSCTRFAGCSSEWEHQRRLCCNRRRRRCRSCGHARIGRQRVSSHRSRRRRGRSRGLRRGHNCRLRQRGLGRRCGDVCGQRSCRHDFRRDCWRSGERCWDHCCQLRRQNWRHHCARGHKGAGGGSWCAYCQWQASGQAG